MWHYIKSAFLVGVDIPQLGRLPVNVLLTAGFVILGVAQPAFWLVGMAAETAIVTSLAFNPRFQKYVQSQQLQVAKMTTSCAANNSFNFWSLKHVGGSLHSD